MVVGTKRTKYKTAPLKSWNKARELRLQHYKEIQEAPGNGESYLPSTERSDQVIKLMSQWHCDGVVIHLRGCENMTYSCMENKLALNQAGIPTMIYEGNQADARELDTNQIINRVDTFMESFGLSKLEE